MRVSLGGARARLGVGSLALALALSGLAGCGGDDPADPAEDDTPAAVDFTAPPDVTVCRADATDVQRPFSAAFPADFTFPPDTTVFNVEDGGATGTIVTGVSSSAYADVVHFLSNDVVAAGFAVTDSETNDGDAEANWNSGDYQGRWSVAESSLCPGETVIQVLAVRVL